MQRIRDRVSRHRSVLCGLTVVTLLAFFVVAAGADHQTARPDHRSVIVAAHATPGGVAAAPLTFSTPPETGVRPALNPCPAEAVTPGGFVSASAPNRLGARAPPPHGCA